MGSVSLLDSQELGGNFRRNFIFLHLRIKETVLIDAWAKFTPGFCHHH